MSKTLIIGGVAAGARMRGQASPANELGANRPARAQGIYFFPPFVPYHVGDVVKARESLLVTFVEVMHGPL